MFQYQLQHSQNRYITPGTVTFCLVPRLLRGLAFPQIPTLIRRFVPQIHNDVSYLIVSENVTFSFI